MDNRYVYDYTPTETGILRTIRQPGGGYSQWAYGAYATLRLFDRNLQFTAQLTGTSVHNGEPYYLDKSHLTYAFQAIYYLHSWNFSGMYYSPQGYPDGCMVATAVARPPAAILNNSKKISNKASCKMIHNIYFDVKHFFVPLRCQNKRKENMSEAEPLLTGLKTAKSLEI